jgi:mercuric ion transport protein
MTSLTKEKRVELRGKEGAIGLVTALLASSCCLLPLAVVFLGLGTGAFMMTTMRYRPILFPLGIVGLGVSYYLYFRERRRCQTEVCARVGKTFNLATLALATLIMFGVMWADFFASM